jgi:hypothetical protein
MRRAVYLLLAAAIWPFSAVAPVFARNVDLSTVLKRDNVQLTIYNSEDLTLVRETRSVTFKKGVNPLQFSWANTLIDPTSVELRFLTSADKLEVLDTTFPHDKPQQLFWNVQSEIDGEATIQITYFTSGIVVRIFRDNGRDGLSYLTQQSVKYIPIGDKIELNLGPDPEVIFEWIKLKTHRNDIWFQLNGVNVFHKLDEQGFRAEPNMSVVGWDDHEVYSQRVRNYTTKPIELEIRRALPGHVVFRSQLDPKLHDYQTVEYKTTVPPGKRVDLLQEVVRYQGRNAKQNNVTLEAGDVRP